MAKIASFDVSRADLGVVVVVQQGGARFGTLAISKGSLLWFPRESKRGVELSWAELDRALAGRGAPSLGGAGGGKRKAASKKKAAPKEKAAPAKKPAPTKKARKTAPSIDLRGAYRGKTLRALLHGDGTITFEGQRYGSPSAAATAAVKHGRRDGWKFWKYQNSRGRWVQLEDRR